MQIKKVLFSYYSGLTYYLSYYFGNIAYPIIYPIITFTYRKVKFYPINNPYIPIQESRNKSSSWGWYFSLDSYDCPEVTK